jgi:uncharacterized protein involved in type VI secretion and phage assembly
MGILDALEHDKTESGKINGVVCGIVTNNKDDKKKLGRIKLKFPWLSDKNETDWVRIATIMAGPGQGSFFLPEKGDEVLVAFENGDINHPYVIGALWNEKAKPPETNQNGKNNIRKIRSRTGHELIFNDETNKGNIVIQTKAGHQIILGDSSGKEKIEIKDKTGNNSILIDSANDSIAISSKTKVSIKAKSIEIEADGSMTIKAGGTLTIKGATVKIN